VDHPLLISLGVALLVAIIYVLVGVSHTKAKITTNDLTYVKAGTHVFHDRSDVFLSKHTTRRHIETSSGGGGGGGGGGHHFSSSGISHGGGGGHR
nr:hypothetical protein [Lachnospiraceae bacterium]